jgi:acyl-CoA thioesterase-1
MCCQDGSQQVRAMQALNQIHNCQGVEFIEIAGGFIGQQHSRLGHERPRNRHALLLSSGQLRRSVLGTSSQPNFGEPFIGPLERLGISNVAHQERHSYVFGSRKIRQEMMPLPDEANSPVSEHRN